MKRALVLAALAVTSGFGHAQAYPSRPIRLVVPFTPGGGTDIIARAIGQHFTSVFGQNVIVDNRAGGNTVIGSEIVARSRPDGYTLLMQINNLTALPAMSKEKTISPEQFAPISLVAALAHVLVVNRTVPANSVKELVALAKLQPGRLSYATPGSGTPVHLASAWFASLAGIDLLHVPYKGAAEYTAAVLGNQTQIVFGSSPLVVPHVKSGALKALGVTTAKRIAQLPQVPTIAESGYAGYDIVSWYGLFAPAKTPNDVVGKLAKQVAVATQSKAFADSLPDYMLIGNTPAEFATFIAKDAELSSRIIAQSGAKAN